MKTIFIFLTTALLLASCSTPQPAAPVKKVEPANVIPEKKTPLAEPLRAMPACLNVQENDRHVEFNGKELWLAETGAPKRLSLDHDRPVTCLKMSIVRNAKSPTVMIEFQTVEEGTSIGISDRKLALASIKDATWIVEPIILTRHFNTEDGEEDNELNVALWSTQQGHAVLTITDSETGSSKIIRP